MARSAVSRGRGTQNAGKSVYNPHSLYLQSDFPQWAPCYWPNTILCDIWPNRSFDAVWISDFVPQLCCWLSTVYHRLKMATAQARLPLKPAEIAVISIYVWHKMSKWRRYTYISVKGKLSKHILPFSFSPRQLWVNNTSWLKEGCLWGKNSHFCQLRTLWVTPENLLQQWKSSKPINAVKHGTAISHRFQTAPPLTRTQTSTNSS